jgi:hypothetical protein
MISPMKMPRWLVVSLLTVSVLAVLGAGVWWWVTWPERTAREFCELNRAGRFKDAYQMHEPPYPDGIMKNVKMDELSPAGRDMYTSLRFDIDDSRSLIDILFGRATITLHTTWAGEDRTKRFVVQRGRLFPVAF